MANRNVTLKRNNAGTSEELYPTTDWSQVNNKPATFTPTAHTHTLSEITDAGTVAAIDTNASTTQFLRGDGTWATPADSDTNTTYTISAVDSSNDAIIRLTGSDATTDDIKLVAGANITLTPSGDNITIAATDTNTTYTLGSFGITATAAELNVLDGITATTTELNYTDGVTSAIQTQLNAKAPLASPALTGTPTAPTANSGTNTTQIATTAFVANALNGVAGGLNFAGSISLSTAKNGDNLAAAGLSGPGDYLIVTATGDITNAGATLVTLAVQAPGDEGDSTLPVTLETGDWIVYVSGDGSTMTVAIINNTDTRFAPTTHTHTIANVTGLQTAIDGKVAKAGDTMTGDLQVKGNGTGRAVVKLVSTANQPNDLYFGANNVEHWSLTSRDTTNAFLGLYNTVGSPGWAWQISNSTNVMDFTANPTVNGNTIFHDGYHPNADKLTTTRNIALTGAVTGNANFDGSGNISIATTNTADPVLTINGDASGSATFTNLGNATLTLTVNDDSHSHSSVSDYANFLLSRDNRTIAPSEDSAFRVRFGFTSWANNNTAPYADYLHMRSYSDSSGGNDNLIMFRKDAIGMRIWQQSFGSGTAYSNYVDVYHTGNLTNLNQLTNGPGYVTSSGVTSVATGGGLTGGTITGTGTISHADTSSQASVNNSGRTYIQDITLDTYGHIIGISSATETVTNTDTNYYLTGVSGSGNGTVTFTRQSLGNLTWNASHTHDDRYYTESESLSLFLRRDVYNSANSGLQVFRNLGTATGSWGDNDHTFGLENSDAGYLTMNFHRAGYTSNNLLYTGTYFNFDLELRVNNSTVWNTGNLTNLNQLSNGPGYVTSSGVTSVATGGGLTGGTITSTGTISHADTSSQGSVNNSGNTFIQDITLDTYGHITAITSATANNVGNADTVDGYHAVAFVRNVYSEFLDSAFPAAPLTTTFTSWSKPVGMPSVTLEANSRYYVFAAGSYYTAATTTGIGISPTFSTVSGQIRGGKIFINTSTSTTAGTSEFSANWRTMSTSGGQTGNFALGTAGPTSNPGNEFGFYGIVETSGNSTVLSMHIRSEVSGSAVNVNRLALTAMKLPT